MSYVRLRPLEATAEGPWIGDLRAPVESVFTAGEAPGELHLTDSSSSLPLQVLLYYNSLTSVVYFFFEGALVIDKLLHCTFSSEIQHAMMPSAFVVWTIGEAVRMHFGWAGNLLEMVPHMSAFLLLTLLPQMLCVVFLASFQEVRYPADKALGGVMMTFLVAELLVGYWALQTISRKRTAQFHRAARRRNEPY